MAELEKLCPGRPFLGLKPHIVPLSRFPKDSSQPDNLDNRCSICHKAWNDAKNNPLKLSFKEKNELEINYLYHHLDIDGKVMYVGVGRDGRAWDFTIRRQFDHADWLLSQILAKRTNEDIAKIQYRNLTRKETGLIEKEHIKLYNPYYNQKNRKDS